ncbi:hypothetical protein DPM19_23660 [Actinomadura craniellae]|uniref:Uncharacterized protein n=2 Tax=Actinomadura craniellae TaxID=2231787 RepID=A0A365H0J6_9ACTN|nr:hypothetical protein DPM19_23660 [Actinomadura craniellae]
MPFNTAAADCRSAIVGVLSSWSALVADERGVAPPRRAAPHLGTFLRRHLDWLARHPGAGDFAAEVAALERAAHRVTSPDPTRRLPVGPCVEPRCTGSLTALVTRDRHRPAEIRCDADPAHTWTGHEWLALGDRPTEAPRWLSPADIECLWDIPRGSVYRLASEQRWRRHRRAGRAYYAAADVQRTLVHRH